MIEEKDAIIQPQIDLIKLCYRNIKDSYAEVIAMHKDMVGDDYYRLVQQIEDAFIEFSKMHIPLFNAAITHVNDLCILAVRKHNGSKEYV